MCNIIVLKITTKCMNNENTPRTNSKRTVKIKIEVSRLYRAEIVQNMPKIRFLTKITGQILLGDWIPFR